jgi:hypothetical protein
MIRAIDVHVHLPTEDFMVRAGGKYMAAGLRFFGNTQRTFTIEEMVEEYEAAGMVGVLLGWDAETHTGLPPLPNDRVAEVVRRYPGRFIGFAGVDPWKGRVAIAELERAVLDLGLKGLKLMPAMQGFFMNDRRFYPLWEKCVELGVPVLTHTGNTGLGAGNPGGSGLKLKYLRPIPHIDDVAADFPELTIIMAHPGWPWDQELLSVAMHKGNVYFDLSGWKPRYIPPQVIHFAKTLLQDKCLFGTDYPLLRPQEHLDAFVGLGWKPEVLTKVLKKNALKLFPHWDDRDLPESPG